MTMKNDTNKTYKIVSYRFQLNTVPESITDAFIYKITTNTTIVVGDNERWNQEWKSNEQHKFTLKFKSSVNIDYDLIKKTMKIQEDYGGFEADETATLEESKKYLTKNDFDVSDGVDELLDEERKIYDSLPENNSGSQAGSNARKIRKAAKPYHINSPEYTLDLKGAKGSKSNGYNYVTQGYYVGSKYIYATNIKKETINNKKRNVLYINRLIKNSSDTGATYNSYMKIINGGHGQTLDLYDYNGKTYFLIDLNSDDNASEWGTQIGRVEFIPNKTIYRDDIVRLNYLNYSLNGISDFGKILRADAAVSTDRKYLLIWKRTANSKTQCTIHNMAAINVAMEKAEKSGKKVVLFNDDMNIKSIQSFTSTKGDYTTSKSQGVDLSNKGSNGLFSIYWSLGDESIEHQQGADVYANRLGIKRYNSAGTFKADLHIIHDFYKEYMEMEAPRIPQSGNFVRILLVPCSRSKRYQYICRVSKDSLISN